MSLPRRLLPGQTHLVTRRTARRRPLLKPATRRLDDLVNQIVAYALGLALSRYDVAVHAFVCNSTHHHGSFTDGPGGQPLPEGGRASDLPGPEHSRFPAFFREFHSNVARALNAHYAEGGSFWAPGSYGNVEAHGELTTEKQLLYVWTNPVADGLVESIDDWPGFTILPEDFGRTITISKPQTAYFGWKRPGDWIPTDPGARARLEAKAEAEARRQHDEREEERAKKARRRGKRYRRRPFRPGPRNPRAPRRNRSQLPDQVTFTVAVPPGYEDWPIEKVRVHFRRLLEEEQARIRAARREAGFDQVLGADRVLAQDPLQPIGDTFPTFELDPRIAADTTEHRTAHLCDLQAWRHENRASLLAWRSGDREVSFPRGSFFLPRYHGARLGPWKPPDVD